jgi:hypothetical protein
MVIILRLSWALSRDSGARYLFIIRVLVRAYALRPLSTTDGTHVHGPRTPVIVITMGQRVNMQQQRGEEGPWLPAHLSLALPS